MPPLLEEYAACPTWPSKAAALAVLTMTPRSSPTRLGLASCARRRARMNVERADEVDPDDPAVGGERSAPSRLSSRTRTGSPMPAQLTTTRTGPSSSAASKAAETEDSSVTSAAAKAAAPPRNVAGDLVAVAAGQVEQDDLRAGRRPGGRAAASPRPLAPPVTTAEAPVTSIPSSPLVSRGSECRCRSERSTECGVSALDQFACQARPADDPEGQLGPGRGGGRAPSRTESCGDGLVRVARRGPGHRPAQRPADRQQTNYDEWTRPLQLAGGCTARPATRRPANRRHPEASAGLPDDGTCCSRRGRT